MGMYSLSDLKMLMEGVTGEKLLIYPGFGNSSHPDDNPFVLRVFFLIDEGSFVLFPKSRGELKIWGYISHRLIDIEMHSIRGVPEWVLEGLW